MNRSFHACILAMFLAVSASTGPLYALSAEQDSLGRVLDGLAPGPRIAYLRYLLGTQKDDPEIYFQLGVAFHEGEKPDSALYYYEKAAAISPRLSKARLCSTRATNCATWA